MTEFAGVLSKDRRVNEDGSAVSELAEDRAVTVRLPDGTLDTYLVWFLTTDSSRFWFSTHYEIGPAGVLEIVETVFDLDKVMPHSNYCAPQSSSVIRTYGISGWMNVEGLKEPMSAHSAPRLMESIEFDDAGSV